MTGVFPCNVHLITFQSYYCAVKENATNNYNGKETTVLKVI